MCTIRSSRQELNLHTVYMSIVVSKQFLGDTPMPALTTNEPSFCNTYLHYIKIQSSSRVYTMTEQPLHIIGMSRQTQCTLVGSETHHDGILIFCVSRSSAVNGT